MLKWVATNTWYSSPHIRFANSTPSRWNDLRKALREQGYELDANPAHKYATLRRIGGKKAVRLYRLGEEYDLPALRERIGITGETDSRPVCRS